jgi:DNA-binding transcriptional ArsR family regulator
MASDTLLSERDGGVGIVTLNRPDRLNATSRELMYAPVDALTDLAKARAHLRTVGTEDQRKDTVSSRHKLHTGLCKCTLTLMMLDTALRAVAEPRRREILRLIHRREMSSGEIASRFDVTRPAISQHLGVLEEAGLVTVRKVGTRRMYRARPEGLADLRQFIEEFWDGGLELLVLAAEEEERRQTHRRAGE